MVWKCNPYALTSANVSISIYSSATQMRLHDQSAKCEWLLMQQNLMLTEFLSNYQIKDDILSELFEAINNNSEVSKRYSW